MMSVGESVSTKGNGDGQRELREEAAKNKKRSIAASKVETV